MSASRFTAIAIALLSAAVAIAGCGFGPGEGVGEVSLTVTRDYGAEPVLPATVDDASESDTVMRVLERNAEISTRYGGGFVQSIAGVSEAVREGRRYDWFFYVNGVESSVGAADFPLHGGEAIWWDYRDWPAASRVPAVVGSWPEPLLDGYDDQRRPVAVECQEAGKACAIVRQRLEEEEIPLASTASEGSMRVLVGSWAWVRKVPAAAQIERGPQVSGVFADFTQRGSNFEFDGLDEEGEVAQQFGPGAGLVAATRRYEDPPVWIVTGTDAQGVRVAARSLTVKELRDRYAVAVDDDEVTPLPVR